MSDSGTDFEVDPAIRDRLALALDVDDLVAAIRLGRGLKEYFGVAKIGLELYSAAGPEAIGAIADLGYKIFLDLKLHDIPTTVGKAARVLGAFGVQYLTMHAHGGVDMLRAVSRDSRKALTTPAWSHPVARHHGAHERRRCSTSHHAEAGHARCRGGMLGHRVRRWRPRRGTPLRAAPHPSHAGHSALGRQRRRPGVPPRRAMPSPAGLTCWWSVAPSLAPTTRSQPRRRSASAASAG